MARRKLENRLVNLTDINEELTENNKKRTSQIETYTEDDIEAATYGLLGDIIKEEK